jgi:hypothetical protein
MPVTGSLILCEKCRIVSRLVSKAAREDGSGRERGMNLNVKLRGRKDVAAPQLSHAIVTMTLRFHRRLPTTAALQRIAKVTQTSGFTHDNANIVRVLANVCHGGYDQFIVC